jgi:16S rRNA processing protein RimM
LVIGRITRPHGVRGEVRVKVHTDLPERFGWLERVFVGDAPPVPMAVENARMNKEWVILKLAGIDDRDAADGLREAWLQVPEAEAIPLEEGEVYLYQLIGLAVREADGRELGRLEEIIETPANDVYVVRGPFGELLLPDIAEVILDIDVAAGVMQVALMPGMLPGES